MQTTIDIPDDDAEWLKNNIGRSVSVASQVRDAIKLLRGKADSRRERERDQLLAAQGDSGHDAQAPR